MRNHVRSFKTFIRDEIIKKGGWVNAHAHADRAFTMTPEKIGIYHNSNLQQKWDLVDEVKRTSSVDDYYARFCQSIELMISQGVTAFGTFVDIDPICEDRAIIAAHKAREVYKHVIIQPDGTQYHIDRKGNYKKFDRTYTEQSSSRPPLGLFLDVFKQERSFVNK